MNNYSEVEEKKQSKFRWRNWANEFLETQKEIRYHAHNWYSCQGNCYRLISEQDLALNINLWAIANEEPLKTTDIKEIMRECSAMCASHRDGDLPLWLGDKEPMKPENVIAFRNGLLDVNSFGAGTLSQHTAKWLSVSCLPFDFDPEAKCPLWLSKLNECYEGDGERIALLQEWFGYCMTQDNSQKKALVLVGLRNSMKTTILKILLALIGDSAVAPTFSTIGDRWGKGTFFGKTVACIDEIEIGKNDDKVKILEGFNAIVGGATHLIERKWKNPFNGVLKTRFCISCNQFPHFYDGSGALSCRLILLPHEIEFPEDKQDKNLISKLSEELSGIANWALLGLKRLREQGFTIPKISGVKKEEYEEESQPKAEFIKDCLKIDPEGIAYKDDLWERWQIWSKETGRVCYEADRQYLYAGLLRLLPKVRKGQDSKTGRRLIRGIRLK